MANRNERRAGKVVPIKDTSDVPEMRMIVTKVVVDSYYGKKTFEVGKAGVTAITETDAALLVKYGDNRIRIFYRRFLVECDLTLKQILLEKTES